MQTLTIEPLIGVNEIKLGQKKVSNNDFLGKADSYVQRGKDWYSELYWNGQLTIQYNNNDIITHIGLRDLGSLNAKVTLYGLDVFETLSNVLIETITQTSKTNFDVSDKEIPYSYKFPKLAMTLWREYLPSDIDEEDEKNRYERFEYIGIGITPASL